MCWVRHLSHTFIVEQPLFPRCFPCVFPRSIRFRASGRPQPSRGATFYHIPPHGPHISVLWETPYGTHENKLLFNLYLIQKKLRFLKGRERAPFCIWCGWINITCAFISDFFLVKRNGNKRNRCDKWMKGWGMFQC